jgi:transcriptional regulator with XRE-family HTH domain
MNTSVARSFGAALREWRRSRGMSQLDLALSAQSSARHLSFLENDRASPSRAMVLRLAEALDVPLRERNALLASAGFAAMFRETPLEAVAMREVRRALSLMLDQQEPYPALVIDRGWQVLMTNTACTRLMSLLDLAAGGQPLNLLRLMMHPAGLRSAIEDWEAGARMLLLQVRRELAAGNDAVLASLLEEVLGYPDVAALEDRTPDARAMPVLPLTLSRDGLRLSWFTTITTFGTPQDVTMQELRVEMFYPADEATDRFARDLAGSAH